MDAGATSWVRVIGCISGKIAENLAALVAF